METMNIQNMTEKDITMVALANIQPSSYNPRKHFDEESLAELAESICRQGVLQPIGVRPLADTDRMEIVFGERRYRAALMAELAEIPSVILHVSDETAVEMAVTENLQRKDVTPIEEANAYQKLIESGRYNVQSLAVQFGKSESYIHSRLKFCSLIPEIAQLLEQDEITISVASQICRYGEDIQQEVYEKHLKEAGDYNSWRGLKAADVARNIERQYTADLDRYAFDKTLCISCPHNTNNMRLFCEGGCGNCANRACLEEMNASYLVEKAMQVLAEYPTALLGHDMYNYNETAVERLFALGYEIEVLKTCTKAYPKQPEVPETIDYDTTEEYEAAYREYKQRQNEYEEKCTDILRRNEEGEIVLYAKIERNGIVLRYMEETVANTGTTVEKQLSPVEKLEKQDRRNKEIALEKTVAEAKKQILEVDMSECKFGQDEDRMIYFFMLSTLRSEHFTAVGLADGHSPYLSDEDKMNIIGNLNAKTKAVIRRDFLIANFKDAYGGNTVASLLLEFARKHMPDTLAGIESGYNEVYEKRHKRIEERKAALLTKERQTKPKEVAEAGDTQPEAQLQTEEVAA